MASPVMPQVAEGPRAAAGRPKRIEHETVTNEELADCAGDEIGFSLGEVMAHDFATGVRIDDLPEFVRYGIGLALGGNATGFSGWR